MKQRQEAYTLIEILVVIMIIGLLSAAGVTSYVRALQNGRDSRRKSDISDVQQALVMYRYEKGEYPKTSDWQTMMNALTSNQNLKQEVKWQDDNYKYTYSSSDKVTFTICANLERETGNTPVSGGKKTRECYYSP